MTPSSTRRSLWFTSALLTLLPAIARADGPVPNLPWLHEGLLFNYSWVTFDMPGQLFVEDEHGNWTRSSDGTNYDLVDRPGTSASGIQQTTVAYLNPKTAVISVQGFADARVNGMRDPVMLLGPQGFAVPASYDLDGWIDPTRLATMQSDPANKILVLKSKWTAQNKTINVIRVIDQSNGYMDHIYDVRTGICVHYAVAVREGPSEGGGQINMGGSRLTQGDFLSTRDLHIPWAHDPTPSWLSTIKVLHCQGYTEPLVQAVPSRVNFKTEVSLIQAGDGWLSFSIAEGLILPNGQTGPAAPQPNVCGHCQFNGLWAGPASLATLQQGQVLDPVDPASAMTTTVSQVTANSVVVAQVNASSEMDSTYDKTSGLRTGLVFISRLAGSRTVVQCVGQE